MTLTSRRRDVLVAIAHPAVGRAPSFREVGEQVGMSSTSTVSLHVTTLIADGYLAERPHDSEGTLRLAPGIAVSRRGEVARIVPVGSCPGCRLKPHHPMTCEDNIAASLRWSVRDVEPQISACLNTPREEPTP